MKYEHFPPPTSLKDYVQYFWSLENPVPDSTRTLGPLVDGCPGLVFQPNVDGTYFDERLKALPELFVYGQTLTRTELYLEGRFKSLGICFFPDALKSVFGLDASDFTDTCFDLTLFDPAGKLLPDQLSNARSVSSQIQILSAYLIQNIKRSGYCMDSLVQAALAEIIQARGNVPLVQIREKLKVSERSLERRFNERVGITPKLYSRICQFRFTLSQIKQQDYYKLTDVAYENGYADQSHFIRTFKAFTGYPPLQYLKKQSIVVEGLS